MKIVIADDLPESAVELLRAEDGWTIDARAGRSAADLARDHASRLVPTRRSGVCGLVADLWVGINRCGKEETEQPRALRLACGYIYRADCVSGGMQFE